MENILLVSKFALAGITFFILVGIIINLSKKKYGILDMITTCIKAMCIGAVIGTMLGLVVLMT